MKNLHSIISRILTWRLRHMSHRHFMLCLSLVIGLVVGLFAVLVKYSVHVLYEIISNIKHDFNAYLLFFLPVIGIAIVCFIGNTIFKEQLGHGITTVLFHISKRSSIMKKRHTISNTFSAIITIAFGGSVGLEGPLIISGSAIGANVAKAMRLHYKSRTLLIGCGSAAAISGIFNSPIAGVIFAIEVILAEVTIEKFIPILLASVSASVMTLVFQQNDALFNFVLKDQFLATEIPFFVVLGVLCGFIALYFTRVNYFIEGKLENIESKTKRILIGGLSLCAIIFLFPALYGEGYFTITALINGNEEFVLQNNILFQGLPPSIAIGLIILFLIFIKAIAAALTIGAGGGGGIFAPALYVGGLSGYLFSRTVNEVIPHQELSTSNFALVGMCGVVSGVQQAPLTGIFLIAEITGGYTLFLPLMIVSAISYTTIHFFEKHSIYTKKLIETGDLIQDNKDKELLSLIKKDKLIYTKNCIFRPESNINDLVDVIQKSESNNFPVIDENNHILGMINIHDIKNVFLSRDKESVILVKTIMNQVKELIIPSDSVEGIMAKFERTNKWCIPVVDDNKKFVGLVYKETLYKYYRQRLVKQSTQDF